MVTLQPPRCPELEHKKADHLKAEGQGWWLEYEVIEGYNTVAMIKVISTLDITIGVALEDCVILGENWKKNEIFAAYAGEFEPHTPCIEWPAAVMEQVKSEVLAPALPPLWVIAAIVGCVAIGGLVLVKVTK